MISSLNGSSGFTGNNSHLRNSASQHGMRLVRQLLSQGSYFVFANIAFNRTSIVDLMECTARGFWDTGLKPTQRGRHFEAASDEIGLA
jgi:hypothetical protein